MELTQIALISKALGDASRVKILLSISKQKGSYQCSRLKNILPLAQPSVSHHIKTLLNAGLIFAEKDGRNHTYHLNKKLWNAYINKLAGLDGSRQ